jgi:hypothetical protein
MQPTLARSPRRHAGIHPALGIGLATLLLVLAACAGGSAAAPSGANGNDDRGPFPAASGGDEQGGSQDPTSGFEDLSERKIIKTGEITLEVDTVATAVGQVRAMAQDLGGYVGGSSSGGADEAATLTLRIPADRFDAALERLHDMDATVKAEATREEDVTSAIVDIEARIRNLEASEVQYRLLLERAEKIDDVLSVQSRLDDVRGQIEQLKAQLTELSGLANLSTLTVTLVPASTPVQEAAEGWDPGATLDKALAALVSLGQAVGTGLIWIAIVGLPLLVVAVIVLVIVRRTSPTFRRRVPKAGE